MDNERISDITASSLFPTAAEFCGEAQTGATYETASKAMKGDYDVLMNETRSTVATDDEKRAFDAAHGLPGNDRTEPEKPKQSAQTRKEPTKAGASMDAAPADPEWFWDVIISVPRKGQKKAEYEKNPDTIGSLYDAGKSGDEDARKRLWGLAQKMDLQPREFNGKTYPPSEGDKQTRKALDAFLIYEEAKGRKAATHMHEAADGGVPEESDQVPF